VSVEELRVILRERACEIPAIGWLARAGKLVGDLEWTALRVAGTMLYNFLYWSRKVRPQQCTASQLRQIMADRPAQQGKIPWSGWTDPTVAGAWAVYYLPFGDERQRVLSELSQMIEAALAKLDDPATSNP